MPVVLPHHWGHRFKKCVSNQWSHVVRVRQHCAESRGFSAGFPGSFHGESWQGGLGLIVRKIMRKSLNIEIKLSK